MKDKPLNNRQLRTRKDLLQSAARLLRLGKHFTLDEVAAEAHISRATAYRYFSSVDELVSEAPVDEVVPDAAELFGKEQKSGPVERLEKAERILHKATYEHEDQLRVMLASSLSAAKKRGKAPTRQNRRTEYIEKALEPYRADFSGETYKNLCASLALIFGTESMIVFSDVLKIGPAKARQIKRWAIRALVEQALKQKQRG